MPGSRSFNACFMLHEELVATRSCFVRLEHDKEFSIFSSASNAFGFAIFRKIFHKKGT